MAGLVVDTHALVWYLLNSPRLSVTARSRLDRVDLPPREGAPARGPENARDQLDCLQEVVAIFTHHVAMDGQDQGPIALAACPCRIRPSRQG
jgi:hypothetical protein